MRMGKMMEMRDPYEHKNIPAPHQRKASAFENLNLEDIMKIVEENNEDENMGMSIDSEDRNMNEP
jgi:hypothetical protein